MLYDTRHGEDLGWPITIAYFKIPNTLAVVICHMFSGGVVSELNITYVRGRSYNTLGLLSIFKIKDDRFQEQIILS